MAITFSQLGKQGRLGNQLWQIAATIAVAKKYNEQYLFPSWQYAPYFSLEGCFANHIPVSKIYNEPYFHYCEIPFIQNTDLSGYYQSYKYFENCSDYIKQIFEYKSPVATQSYTSIHVRRGDYVDKSEYHSNLSNTNYYEQAIGIMNSDKYLVFSDDIGFCKTKFKGDKFVFVENGSPQTDIVLMSACENNIIANSSFSYWAAFLNKNPNKKVIAPQTWFGPKLQHNIKDLLIPDWIQI